MDNTTTLNFELSAAEVASVYIEFLRDWSDTIPTITLVDVTPDEDLIALGLLICESFAAGMTVERLAETVVGTFGAYDTEGIRDSAVIAGAAVGILCPEHQQGATP